MVAAGLENTGGVRGGLPVRASRLTSRKPSAEMVVGWCILLTAAALVGVWFFCTVDGVLRAIGPIKSSPGGSLDFLELRVWGAMRALLGLVFFLPVAIAFALAADTRPTRAITWTMLSAAAAGVVLNVYIYFRTAG